MKNIKNKLLQYTIFIIIIVLSNVGCINKNIKGNKTIDTSNQLNNKNEYVPISTNDVELYKEKGKWEYRYYSKDLKNYIKAVVTFDNNETCFKRELYLNETSSLLSTQYLLEYDKDISPGGMWISNNQALIDGKYILNITDLSMETIDFSSVANKDQQPLDYRISMNGNMIAYIFLENYEKEKVLIYNIENKKWDLVFRKDITFTSDVQYLVFWDKNDNVYFDTCDMIDDKKDNSDKLVFNIFKYSLNNHKLEKYKEGYSLKSCSSDFAYLVLHDWRNMSISDNYELINLEDNNVINKFSARDIAWGNGSETMAYVKNNTLNIYSLALNKIIKNINIDINKDESFIGYLDSYEHNYVFYLENDTNENVLGDIYKVK